MKIPENEACTHKCCMDPANLQCQGSRCMAWVAERKVVASPMPMLMPPRFELKELTGHGWCGHIYGPQK